eukprot:3145314-Amphidinium_carterae.2
MAQQHLEVPTRTQERYNLVVGGSLFLGGCIVCCSEISSFAPMKVPNSRNDRNTYTAKPAAALSMCACAYKANLNKFVLLGRTF